MADFFINSGQRIVGVSLTAEEYARVEAGLALGQWQREVLTAVGNVLRQISGEKRKQDMEVIANYVKSATDAQRASIIALITGG